MEWRLHMNKDSWEGHFTKELSEIDPGLPTMVSFMAGCCMDDGETMVSELMTRLVHNNPLDYPPTDKDGYEHAVERFLLDAYMRAGVSEGTDILWEAIRKPARTKCCSPYLANMYHHLSTSTRMSVEDNDHGGVDLILTFE